MAETTISVERFYKSFGEKKVISNLSFEVKQGDFFAFLGTNGAGKTTTIRVLLGIYQPDEGQLLIKGKKYTPAQAGLVGYLPEERGIFLNSRVLETLIYFGQLKGLNGVKAKTWSMDYLKRVELDDKAYTEIKKLSSGQQQKIQVGITLIGNPPVLILDEPTRGLDPLNRNLLFEMLIELEQQGSTIMLSTHHFEEIEKLCKRLLILKDGKAAVYGDYTDIKKKFSTNKLKIYFEGNFVLNEKLFSAMIHNNYAEVIPKKSVESREILQYLLQQPHLKINSFESGVLSLEEIFIQTAQTTS